MSGAWLNPTLNWWPFVPLVNSRSGRVKPGLCTALGFIEYGGRQGSGEVSSAFKSLLVTGSNYKSGKYVAESFAVRIIHNDEIY